MDTRTNLEISSMWPPKWNRATFLFTRSKSRKDHISLSASNTAKSSTPSRVTPSKPCSSAGCTNCLNGLDTTTMRFRIGPSTRKPRANTTKFTGEAIRSFSDSEWGQPHYKTGFEQQDRDAWRSIFASWKAIRVAPQRRREVRRSDCECFWWAGSEPSGG